MQKLLTDLLKTFLDVELKLHRLLLDAAFPNVERRLQFSAACVAQVDDSGRRYDISFGWRTNSVQTLCGQRVRCLL